LRYTFPYNIIDGCKASISSSIATFHPKLENGSETFQGIQTESKDVINEK